MVELSLEIISIIIAYASITVGVINVLMQNRRYMKTKEAHLFMQY